MCVCLAFEKLYGAANGSQAPQLPFTSELAAAGGSPGSALTLHMSGSSEELWEWPGWLPWLFLPLVERPEIPRAQMNSGEKILLSPETMHGVCRHSWSWGRGGSRGWSPALCPSSGTLLSSESPADGPCSDSDAFLDALNFSSRGSPRTY